MGHNLENEVHYHEHTHEHSHEHMHDGVAHTHSHGHAHSHEHRHSHEYNCGDAHGHSHDHIHEDGHEHHHEHHSMHELLALVGYMCEHNISHTKELEELGESLKETENTLAYEKLTAAVAEYEKGNQLLQEVLDELNK